MRECKFIYNIDVVLVNFKPVPWINLLSFSLSCSLSFSYFSNLRLQKVRVLLSPLRRDCITSLIAPDNSNLRVSSPFLLSLQ
jgi:hypothetical protein